MGFGYHPLGYQVELASQLGYVLESLQLLGKGAICLTTIAARRWVDVVAAETPKLLTAEGTRWHVRERRENPISGYTPL